VTIKKPRILFYDIETLPLKAYVWGLGKQVVRHQQLVKDYSRYKIMTIQYCWNDKKKATVLKFDFKTQCQKKMLMEFMKVVNEADIVIGKNNKRFDDKHINAQMMFHGLPILKKLVGTTDDLESQMRRHFYLPSHSLDYISNELGLGGKLKMDLDDWISILERDPIKGQKAFDRMCKYGGKDVEDTRELYYRLMPYCTPKFNKSVFNGCISCTTCGSTAIIKNGTRISGGTKYQMYACTEHKGYAGKHPINQEDPIKLT